MLKLARSLVGALALLAGAAACGGTSTAAGGGSCNSPPQPFDQLLYPIPGTKNVSPNVGFLILAGNEKQLPWLTSDGTFVKYAKIVPLPNPLPQPERTPAPGATIYAASLGTLTHQTKYTVNVSLVIAYCDPFSYPKKLGSFTTR
jgi:hypothetical protein